MKTRLLVLALGLCTASATLPIRAQSYPTRPIEVVNTVAPGGANDINVRALQVSAQRALGQPLVQIFKPGGAGTIGVGEVASAAPDGYKLLVATPGELVVGPNLLKTPYSIDSFTFIARISSKPFGIVVNASSPWKTFDDLRRDVAAQPDKHTMGTTQAGAVFLTAKEILRRGNLRITTVPYSGAGPYLTALLGNHIDSALSPMAAAESHLKAGTMRLLAVTGPARMKNHPNAPTVGELGIDVPYVQWVGIVAPKGMAPERVAKLRDGFAQMVKDPAFIEAAEKIGIDISYAGGEEFEKQVRDENRLISALVKDLGLTPQ
jgi:tripartite-type tricarboxylate transporter receptor subunit TctC